VVVSSLINRIGANDCRGNIAVSRSARPCDVETNQFSVLGLDGVILHSCLPLLLVS